MWSVYNVLQEKIIHGMFETFGAKGKVRKARKIKNFQQDTNVNKELYELAVEYVS
jgi:predicted metal-dependent peptidase